MKDIHTHERQPAPGLSVAHGAATHTGHHRAENEDALLARAPIFVVADGMGGHDRGREAAARVVREFDLAVDDPRVTPMSLGDATTAAVLKVRELAAGATVAPGSTVTGVGLFDHDGCPSWLVFNIGDSRTYRLQSDVLEQITVDHSGRQELLDRGLSLVEAHQRVPANVITRAIGGGMRNPAVLDQWVLPVRAGDRMIVCSDGLTCEVDDELLRSICVANPDPQDAANALVTAALAAGGHDNVTVVIVDAVLPAGLAPHTHQHDETHTDTVEELVVIDADAGDTVPDRAVL